MSTQFSIANLHERLLQAAQLLSSHLHKLGVDHAYIGGFAWSLLGSQRPTQDVDVMVKVENPMDVQVLRSRLSELDPRFVRAGLKLYVSQGSIDLSRDTVDQLTMNEGNVLIEMLPAGSLGLPQIPKPVLDKHSIPVLHPSILVLTKLKRWAMSLDSTRPKTVAKNAADAEDIRYMIRWLAENDLKIEFDQYAGKTRDELVPFVREFRNKFADDECLMAALRVALAAGDWDLL